MEFWREFLPENELCKTPGCEQVTTAVTGVFGLPSLRWSLLGGKVSQECSKSVWNYSDDHQYALQMWVCILHWGTFHSIFFQTLSWFCMGKRGVSCTWVITVVNGQGTCSSPLPMFFVTETMVIIMHHIMYRILFENITSRGRIDRQLVLMSCCHKNCNCVHLCWPKNNRLWLFSSCIDCFYWALLVVIQWSQLTLSQVVRVLNWYLHCLL